MKAEDWGIRFCTNSFLPFRLRSLYDVSCSIRSKAFEEYSATKIWLGNWRLVIKSLFHLYSISIFRERNSYTSPLGNEIVISINQSTIFIQYARIDLTRYLIRNLISHTGPSYANPKAKGSSIQSSIQNLITNHPPTLYSIYTAYKPSNDTACTRK